MKNLNLKITIIMLTNLSILNPLLSNGFAKDFLDHEDMIHANIPNEFGIIFSDEVTRANNTHQPIMLDPGILTLVDGTFFEADILEMLINYQHKIMDILLGTKTKASSSSSAHANRIGKYTFMGTAYGAYHLAAIEKKYKQTLSQQQKNDLAQALAQAKQDLIILSEVFRDKIRGAKALVTSLIQDSCAKRNRPDSVLIIWSHMKNPSAQEENKIFEKYVTSFEAYVTFSTDLHNFLTDVINSCPKAQQQYRMRIEKFKKITQILATILSNNNKKNIDKTAFLGHIKKKHLDSLLLEHITVEKINSLIVEFLNQKK